jgi:hypothetical protein
MLMSKKLVRFQLPGSWAVCYNSFGDEDMIVVDGLIENFQYYKEDLLWLQSMRRAENADTVYELDPAGWLADVGWYPDSDPDGAYTLHVFRANPDLVTEGWPAEPPAFRSRNRSHVIAVLEHIIYHIWYLNDTEGASRQRLVELQLLHDQNKLANFLSSISYS